MSMPRDAEPSMRVVCPSCRQPQQVERAASASVVRCRGCGARLVVAADDRPSPQELPRLPLAGSGRPLPGRFLLTCPRCKMRMQPLIDQAGQAARCAGCGVALVVPRPATRSGDDPSGSHPAGRTAHPPAPAQAVRSAARADRSGGQRPVDSESLDVYRLAGEATAPKSAPAPIRDDGWPAPPGAIASEDPAWPAAGDRRADAPAPRRRRRAGGGLPSLVAGVFNFPFYLTTLLPWFLMSLWLFLLAALANYLWGLYESGAAYVAAGSFLAMGLVWLGVWTLTYTASCAAVVVEETASGSDAIGDWPLFNWRDWLWSSLPVFFVAALAAGLAYGLELLAAPLLGLGGLVFAGAMLVLFPLFWLSTLEQGSPLAVFSRPVWASLIGGARHWLVFLLLEAGLLGGGAVCLVLVVATAGPYSAAVLAAPLAAGTLLVYARLVGRLGARISQAGALGSGDEAGDDNLQPAEAPVEVPRL